MAEADEKMPGEKHAATTWAKRLKRVFDIDVQTCGACGGTVKIVAAIEDPVAIQKILTQLQNQGAMPQAYHRPAVRGPP